MNIKYIFYLLGGLLLIFYFVYTSAINVLPVRLSPQQRNLWCWAASTEMIINYEKKYKTAIAQCELLASMNNCCTSDLKCDSNNDECNFSLTVDDFEALLNDNNYRHTYLDNILDSSLVIQQIDSNKPFIVGNLIQKRAENLWANHYFVVYGYLNTFDKLWVFVKDPWATCQGCTYAIPYKVLANGGENLERSYPEQTPVTFYNFSIQNSDNNFFYNSIDYLKQFALNQFHTINNYSFKKIAAKPSKMQNINEKEIYKHLTPFMNIASEDILKQFGLIDNNNIKISNVIVKTNFNFTKNNITPTEVIVIVNILDKNNQPISEISMMKNGDYWEIIGISACTWLPIAKAVAHKNSQLNFDLTKIIEKEHIAFLPTQYQFYKFEYDNKNYYYPKDSYPNILDVIYDENTFRKKIQPLFQELIQPHSKITGLKPTLIQKPSQRPQEQN